MKSKEYIVHAKAFGFTRNKKRFSGNTNYVCVFALSNVGDLICEISRKDGAHIVCPINEFIQLFYIVNEKIKP
jgi:phage-related holin